MADKLAILSTARGAYRFVWQHRRRFISLAFPAIVVLSIVAALVVRPYSPAVGHELGWGEIVASVAELVLWVMFAVAWHRRYLAPAVAASTVGQALMWRRRHARFLLAALGIGLLVLLGSAVIGAVVYLIAGDGPGGAMIFPASALAILYSLYVYARLSLLFPARAVDRQLGFAECIRLTRGNGWRLVAILVLVIAPFWIALSIGLAMTAILGTFGGMTGTLIGALFHQGLNFAGIAIGVSALSIAYRELVPAAAVTDD
jgi:hypothetical protein